MERIFSENDEVKIDSEIDFKNEVFGKTTVYDKVKEEICNLESLMISEIEVKDFNPSSFVEVSSNSKAEFEASGQFSNHLPSKN